MAANKQGTRRDGRQKAFQCVFSLGFINGEAKAHFLRTYANFFDGEDPVPAKERGFALDVLNGVADHCTEVDSIIAAHSQHWRFERIAKVELGILRVAVFEMLHRPDIPLRVSINEAVELSKAFGDENSRSFINGILDAVAKGVKDGQFGIHKAV